MNISISRDGVEIGEWTEEQVREFYKEGQLVPTDFYWTEGMPEWKPLRTYFKPPPPTHIPVGVPLVTESKVDSPTSFPNDTPLHTSKFALSALICGCLSLFFLVVFSCFGSLFGIPLLIAAILFGHIGLSETRNSATIKGRGKALAGTILGYIALTYFIGTVVYIVTYSLPATVEKLRKYESQVAAATSSQQKQSDLSVDNVQWGEDPYGSRCLTGTVTNNGSVTHNGIMIKFNFYDTDGNPVGDGSSQAVMNLEPGKTFSFFTVGNNGIEKASSFKMVSIKMFQ